MHASRNGRSAAPVAEPVADSQRVDVLYSRGHGELCNACRSTDCSTGTAIAFGSDAHRDACLCASRLLPDLNLMLLAIELSSLTLLVLGLFAVRWHTRRQRRSVKTSAGRKARFISARTEMRAFGDSVTVMRTLDRSNGNARALPKREARHKRA